jgi:hypothetical protein
MYRKDFFLIYTIVGYPDYDALKEGVIALRFNHFEFETE